MDLANMRANGVRSLAVTCLNCRRESVVNVDNYPNHMTVPSFGRRMRCNVCGATGADVRPNWKEKAERPSLTGEQWTRA